MRAVEESAQLQDRVVENRTKKELKEMVIQATGMSESTFNTLFRRFEATEGVMFTPQTLEYCYTNPNTASKVATSGIL